MLEEAELKSTVDVFAVVQMASAETTALLQTSARELERICVRENLLTIFHPDTAAGVKERGGSLSTFSISSGSSSVVSEEKFVNSLIAFRAGFVCSVGAGKVAVFELERPLKELIGDDEIKFKGAADYPNKMLLTSKLIP